MYYIYVQEDWGELNVGKKPPGLFVLDLKRWSVKAVEGLPADSSAGQPEWTPDGKPLVGLHALSTSHLPLCCDLASITGAYNLSSCQSSAACARLWEDTK